MKKKIDMNFKFKYLSINLAKENHQSIIKIVVNLENKVGAVVVKRCHQ